MAHDLGTARKGSVNIELNIIPFIDVMSCLTAFLLYAAVWTDLAHLRNQPAGKTHEIIDPTPHPMLTVLVEHDQIVLTELPSGEAQQIGANDWATLEAAMKHYQFAETPRVEIAANSTPEHPIPYQTLIAAMDTAVKAGYPDVGVTDPYSMSR